MLHYFYSLSNIETTKQLVGHNIGITLIDHAIVTSNDHYSFKTHDLL
ncbi:JAB domain-containing protein [Ehrlichia canis]|nr:JAB domain-containing protein [Ehrlichia canis]